MKIAQIWTLALKPWHWQCHIMQDLRYISLLVFVMKQKSDLDIFLSDVWDNNDFLFGQNLSCNANIRDF